MTMTGGNFNKQTRQFILLGIITAAAFAAIIAMVSSKTGTMVLNSALEHSKDIASRHGNAISSRISEAMCTARALAHSIEAGMSNRDSLDRELFDRFFIDAVSKSDEFFFGAWAVMKPGRLDGRDAAFAGKPGYGPNGDYVPYAYRENGRIVFKHDPYEGEKDKPYFTIPQATGRESLIEPYVDPTAENAVMSSVAVPIFDGEGIAGVAGVDILLSSLNREISAIKPFDSGYVFLVADTGFIVAHPQTEMIGRNVAEFGSGPEVLDAVRAGRETVEKRVDPKTGKMYHFVYVPMKIGNTMSVWSVGVAIPMDMIMNRANSITHWTSLVGISSVLLLTIMLFLIARSVIVPLRKSETAVRRAFDHVHDAVIIHSGSGRIIDANEQTLTLYGISLERISQVSFLEDLSASDNPFEELPKKWGEVLEGKAQTFEWRAKRADSGEVFDVEVHLAALELHGDNVIVATIHDLTDRKRMESDILRASKLESLGTLAGGIAHDFNNFLMGIYGNISLARNRAAGDEKITSVLERAEKAVTRASSLTKQLITFSRGGKPFKTFICLNDLILNSVLFSLSGSEMAHSFDLDPALWPIEADEGQISQVVTNIVLNADQARAGKGRLTVKTENVHLDKPAALLPSGWYAKITISDDGPGISQENVAKIFDPYFSTKPGGTGLGLSTSYSIVKSHGGDIVVNSALRQGTEFVIFLPSCKINETELQEPGSSSRVEIQTGPPRQEDGAGPSCHETPKVSTEEGEVPSSGADLPDGRGPGDEDFIDLKILLMDDDETVLMPLAESLIESGYTVETATDGDRAVDLYVRAMAAGIPFDVVILDLVVPGGVGGMETIGRLRQIDPDVCAVISSGYFTEPVMSDYRVHGFSQALRKPYEYSELARAIKGCGRRRAGGASTGA